MRKDVPLAERMRPQSLDEYVGQRHLLGPGKPLRRWLEAGDVPSCVLYGPPGVGKTALTRLMAHVTRRPLLELNAVTAKVSELRDLIDQGAQLKRMGDLSPIVFVDELFHFNKSQQNALLPSVERGDVILVGTTTENPRFEINKQLMSRLLLFTLEPLSDEELAGLLARALADEERGLGGLGVEASPEVLRALASASAGDARQALTRLEFSVLALAGRGGRVLTLDHLREAQEGAFSRFDKKGDDHYAVISAFIKSIRGSDPDAAVYWLARMIDAGEDPNFIARRLLISAAEDVGLANPNALVVANAGAAAAHQVGWPEARIILAEVALYLAASPKSNSAYCAINDALADVARQSPQPVPPHLINGNSDYRYPHDFPDAFVVQKYLSQPKRFFHPHALGAEGAIAARLEALWGKNKK